MCRSWQGVLTCRRRVGFVNKSNWRCHEGSRPSSTAIVFFTPGLGVDRAITRYCSSSSKDFLLFCEHVYSLYKFAGSLVMWCILDANETIVFDYIPSEINFWRNYPLLLLLLKAVFANMRIHYNASLQILCWISNANATNLYNCLLLYIYFRRNYPLLLLRGFFANTTILLLTSMEKQRFLLGIVRMRGAGLPMPKFFGPFSRSAFLVNKKSLFLQKC